MVKSLGKKFIIKVCAALLVALFFNASAKSANFIARSDQAEISLLGGSYVDGKAQLGLRVKMQPGWHIYWRYAGDSGFPPVLDWSGSANFSGAEFLWPAPKRLRQELQPDNFLESYTYSDQVTFPIEVKAQDSKKPLDILLNVSYAICAQTCIPGQADLSLNLQNGFQSSANLEIIAFAKKLVPKANGTYGINIESVSKLLYAQGNKQFIEVTASNVKDFSEDATILIEAGDNFLFNNPATQINGKHAKFTVPVTFITDKKDLKGASLTITLINNDESVEITKSADSPGDTNNISLPENKKYSYRTLLLMIIFAFIGGLILNVMPCVLPIISIKILGIVKHGGGKKSEVTASFLVSALGILVSFLGLALITIWLKSAGEIIGWGFNFQQPYFIITLVIILTILAANLWGLFEIGLPGNLASSGTQPEGMFGHFMSGVLATILATPCTAPFLGTAVGFSITRGAFEILVIFLSMGAGLASPYLLFSMLPGMITKLPKPGAWMVKVKHVMGILLALAAIWLIWVLSNQLGKMAADVLLALCFLQILKFWAAKHVYFIKKIKIPLFVIIMFLEFIIPIRLADKIDTKNPGPGNDIWEEFKPDDIQPLVSNGKIVFVDITADWCLTCKVNKLAVLNSDEIKHALENSDVVAMQGDWTNPDSQIAAYLGKYERLGIPFNIVYGPGAPKGIVLSELLGKKDVIAALNKARGK
jgi:suppressor for copper-sensitivity B